MHRHNQDRFLAMCPPHDTDKVRGRGKIFLDFLAGIKNNTYICISIHNEYARNLHLIRI